MVEKKYLVAVVYAVVLVIAVIGAFYVGRMTAPAPEVMKPIRIGMTCALTGGLSIDASFIKEGALMWERDTNLAGGLLGRPVQIVMYDDESNPERCVRLYEKLITEDKVDILIGPFGSGLGFAMSAVVEKYKWPCLLTACMASEIYSRGFKYIYQVFTDTYDKDGEVLMPLQLWKSVGAKTVAILTQDSAWPKSCGEAAHKLASEYGLEVVYHEVYPVDAKDLSAPILKIKALAPDVIFQIGYYFDNLLFSRQAAELGLTAKMMLVYLAAQGPKFNEELGVLSNNIVCPAQWVPDEKLPYPGIATFIEEYKKLYGRPPDQRSAIAYHTLQVTAECVRRAGGYEDKEKLREEILKIDFNGVFGSFKVDAAGFQIGHKCVIIQWQNGKQVIIWPPALETGTLVYPFPGWGE